MKIGDGKQPSRFRFLLSRRVLRDPPRLVQRWGIEHVCPGPIPPELQPVPYSLPETHRVLLSPHGAQKEVGRQRRLWDSSLGGFCLNFSPWGGLGLGFSVQSPPVAEH